MIHHSRDAHERDGLPAPPLLPLFPNSGCRVEFSGGKVRDAAG